MIGALTLLGNIFYGIFMCEMKNANANNTPMSTPVNRILAGNNDIEMKRLQQSNVMNQNFNKTNSYNSNTTMTTDNSINMTAIKT